MSERIYAGLTSQTIDILFLDSSSSTGAGLAGVLFNSAGISAYYRKGATGSATSITLATQTVGGAYSSGGLVLIDDTNMPGLCRLDLPNAMVDTEGIVTLYIQGVTNMAPLALRIDCKPVPANALQISDDATAADNLELQYDGTGLTGDVYPATQAQIGTAGAGLTDITINAASVDAIWDEVITNSVHNDANSAGKRLRQASASLSAESTVNDASASTTTFITALTEATDDYYNNCTLTFLDGALAGQSRIIADYNGTTKAVTFDEALTDAPANGAEFQIAADHVHPVSEIADAVLDEAMSGHTAADSLGLFLNDQYDLAVTGITTGVETRAGKHSVAGTVMMSTNAALSGGTLTAKKPSDDTTFQTYTVTTDSAANNITGMS